jgi:hypothetical protein
LKNLSLLDLDFEGADFSGAIKNTFDFEANKNKASDSKLKQTIIFFDCLLDILKKNEITKLLDIGDNGKSDIVEFLRTQQSQIKSSTHQNLIEALDTFIERIELKIKSVTQEIGSTLPSSSPSPSSQISGLGGFGGRGN